MTEIIKVELFRIKRSVLFWVMFGIIVALPILAACTQLSIVGVTDTIIDAANGSDSDLGASYYGDNLTISFLNGIAQYSSNAAILALITAAIVLSHEFSDGTIRNILLANRSRAELYFGYLITTVIISMAFLLGNFASVMIVVAPIFGFGELSAGQAVSACFTSLALGIIAILFVSSCMCMFLFAMRKQWAAILMPLLICFAAPVLIGFIIGLVVMRMAVRGETEALASLANNLRWVPFVGISEYNCTNIDGVIVGMHVLYFAVFIAMFVVIGFFTFRKADLK